MSKPVPLSPALMYGPPTQTLKRKLGQRSPSPPTFAQAPSRTSNATMSHVEIPRPVTIKASEQSLTGDHVAAQRLASTMEGAKDIERADPAKSLDGLADAPALLKSHHSLDSNLIIRSHPTAFSRTHRPRPVMKPRQLRDKIEEQFGLEIMLKHRELRLIEQELAKCQVAFEQLRRCHAIPYPVLSSDAQDMVSVSEGSGQAYSNKAPLAPSWGVADGPYTRHYERWLLPDPAFDDLVADNPTTPSTAGKRLPDRPTRGMNPEKGVFGSQSRSQRNTAVGRLKALPQGYPETKEEKGPMIVERKSDRHLVKLVCLDCRRSNFNSVQGFINHCRIAHSRQFASHDVAIEASGEEIDAANESSVVSEPASVQGPISTGLVHPMIRSARPPPAEPSTPMSSALNSHLPSINPSPSLSVSANPRKTPSTSPLNPLPSVSFNPSPQTPHLSAFYAMSGNGGDLDELVRDAKNRDQIDLLLAMEPEESSDEEPEEPALQSRSTRGIAQSSVRPASSAQSVSTGSNLANSGQTPGFTPTYPSPAPARLSTSESPFNPPSPGIDGQGSPLVDTSLSNLSPNTTDPHPAPSLVSDDGDYDNTHSESEASSQTDIDEQSDHYVHPDFFHHDDFELGEGSGFDLAHGQKEAGSTLERRSRPSTAVHDSGQERHVTFASPVRMAGKDSRPLSE